MRTVQGNRGRATGGFTLVELLVVMGIIGLLVGLLMPAVTQAIVASRTAATKNTISDVSVALAAFRQDWRCYPPSDGSGAGVSGVKGAGALSSYLMGPDGKGWGKGYQDKSPFGGEAKAQFGPYYKVDQGGTGSSSSIVDGFRPPKPILYYRYDPGRNYEVTDNATDTQSPCVNGFYDKTQFELLVKPKDNFAQRWVREDYLLISAGADRYFGHVRENATTGKVEYVNAPASLQCDDVCNFLR